MAVENRFQTPDFAFPQTVGADARQMLERAESMSTDSAGIVRLRALLMLSVASASVDRDSIFVMPDLIGRQADACRRADDRAMLLALEAGVLDIIYRENRYAYDRVDAPALPRPEKVSLWSGRQFRTRIDELADSALMFAAAAGPTPLQRYSDCLEYSDGALEYVPDVQAFVRLLAVNFVAGTDDVRKEALIEGGLEYTASGRIDSRRPGSAPYIFWLYMRDKGNAGALAADYRANEEIESARLLLMALCDTGYENVWIEEPEVEVESESAQTQSKDELIGLLRHSLQVFPDWVGNVRLRYSLAELTKPELHYTVPSLAAPGSSVNIKVNYGFAGNICIDVYRLSDDAEVYSTEEVRGHMPLVESLRLIPDSERGTGTLVFTPDAPGRYALVGTVDSMYSYSPSLLTVTPVLPVSLGGCERTTVITTDYVTGAPLGGVTVLEKQRDYRAGNVRMEVLGRTDGKGLLSTEISQRRHINRTLAFRYGKHTYYFNDQIGVGAFRTRNASEQTSAQLLTDRALYHPGDTVSWALVLARISGADGGVLAGKPCKVIFYDANDQEVDSAVVRTDSLGRASGRFPVPRGGLAGTFRMVVKDGKHRLGSAGVTVSDFRLPTMFVTVDGVHRNVPSAGEVTLTGRVRTYSGMPVAAARISSEIMGAMRWWRGFMPSVRLGTVEASASSDGTFSIVVPDSVLSREMHGEKYTDFVARITATSANAEIAETTCNFFTGKPLLIHPYFPSQADGSEPGTVRIEALDAEGANRPVEVTWRIGVAKDGRRELGSIVASGDATTGTPFGLDLSDVPAGRYSVEVVPADTALADKYFITDGIIVYNTGTNAVPDLGTPFFVPDKKYVLDGNSAKVLVGIVADDVTVYAVVRSGSKIVRTEPCGFSRGFHYIKAVVPDDSADDNELMLISVRDGHVYTESKVLSRPQPEAVKISAETFRDKLVPGNRETWRFRIVRGEAPVAGAAMAATMYNSAMDALTGHRFGLYFGLYANTYYLNVRTFPHILSSYHVSVPVAAPSDMHSLDWPEWLFLKELRFRSHIFYARSLNAMAMKETMMMDSADTVESESEVEDVEETAAVADNAAAVVEESAGDDAGETQVTSGQGADVAGESDPVVEYRDPEVYGAFFDPLLVSDADGNVDIVFTVPDANGAWSFRGVAWTDALEVAQYSGEAVSAKPVMVRPNLPRFLRQGDCARLGATVFNNTDSSATVRTTVELFNPADGSIIRKESFTSEIGAKGSAVIAVDAVAPADKAAIGYRVRAVSGRFADGEQSAIPVLSSSATVIESTEFYLNPADSTIVLDIPVKPATTYTLQYCSNPIWTVVKAMRGLSDGHSSGSVGLAGQIYSALAARKIASANPSIADAYRQWQDNPGDEALTSMLRQNSGLKTLLLDQTPWVQAAADNSARMAALGRIFDNGMVEADLTEATEALAGMQNADGGIAWTSWSGQSSDWATRSVLLTLGIANSMDMLGQEDRLRDMAAGAFAYVQAQATAPHAPETDDVFAMICTLWPDAGISAAGRELLNRTVSRMASRWRDLGTVQKAAAVLVFKANGRVHLAAQVLESIRQFGVERPGQGLCFPSVDDIRGYATIIRAFSEMGAPRATLDAMRQWVTVQAQASDDLGAYNPDYVIASVLLTGSDWTSAPLAFGLSVDGQPLASTAQERATGYTVAPLSPSGDTMRIVVRPNGATPCYGSVLAVGERQQAEVAARPGRDLSVGKRFLVERNGQWVETDSFALGERVRVQLIIEAGRDMEYVAVTDRRPASFEPVEQMPGYVYDGTLAMYRENGDTETRLFVSRLSAGTYHISYDMTANNAGTFISGIVTIQSQYAPELTAHSGGTRITVETAR